MNHHLRKTSARARPRGASAPASLPSREPGTGTGSQGRILVVDDNHDAADTLSILLQFQDYEVRTAYDGREAVDMALEFDPDLVVLDINMPVMNGYAAARLLRRAKRETPVVLIALTARASTEDEAEARRAGFDIHVCKPADGTTLGALIAEALAKRH